jgi:penicillin G amidase
MRWRPAGRLTSLLGAVLAAAVVMIILGAGIGQIPPLGPALNPGRGAWAAAADAVPPLSGQLNLGGLRQPVQVSFTSSGMAAIRAASDADLFLAQGYVTARFRLAQMDLERRVGEGRLAELTGPSNLASDKLELTLGLQRTAQAEWAAAPAGSAAAVALESYAQGVNDWISQLRVSHDWPSMFALTGVYPRPWTPVDSLVVQGLLTQELSFTSEPLDYEVLVKSLGAARTSAWFPVEPVDAQAPYDPGPYALRAIAPMPTANPNAEAPVAHTAGDVVPGPVTAMSGSTADAALATIAALPSQLRHLDPDSNAWAVNGPLAGDSRTLLAGDPHLSLTLPSYWYDVGLSSPGFDVTGASLPGVPAVVIGRNRHVSWSLTATQNQSVFFYREQTAGSRPDMYFWKGAWRQQQEIRYTIPVRGAAPVQFSVALTGHGPVLTSRNQTVSVYWTGSFPSPDVSALLGIDKSADWASFRAALRSWHAPVLNFLYADDAGNIGIMAPGYYPQVAVGDPRAPLPGGGNSDVIGTIPFSAIPQVYDPPAHRIVTANQRPVSASYPYYIGSAEMFDQGYRARRISDVLSSRSAFTSGDFDALQSDVYDELAAELVPKLLAALDRTQLTSTQRAAAGLLSSWPYQMSANSAAASVWWQFFKDYVIQVFQPWWKWAKVPVKLDPRLLDLNAGAPVSLMQDLERWTLSSPGNAAFTPPGGPHGTATTAMRAAFADAVKDLSTQLGGVPSTWTWDRIHKRIVLSLTGAPGLAYGPFPSGGDPWTVDAADDGMTSDFGPSWRMVIDWQSPGTASGQFIYPGGQSENPASSWYDNLVPLWREGKYEPLVMPGAAAATATEWKLEPDHE